MPAQRNNVRAHSDSDWTELDLWLQLANIHYWFRETHGTTRLLDTGVSGDEEPKRGAAAAGVVGQRR